MMARRSRLTIAMALLLSGGLSASGCAAVAFTAAAGGGGWETYQNSEMETLEQKYASGEIDQQQFEARKAKIQQASLLQR